MKGYNAEAGDWFWAKDSPREQVVKSGKIGACISCHSSAEENDFIVVHEFE